ncbi:MAG: hypothetical protein NTZ02_03735 [Candidatus Woesearchaeota archaeon]|nr:hypothetical protein [Candidatus Woesearchaeota archaeon]
MHALLFLLSFLIAFSYGCGNTTTTTNNYRTGTRGIEINYAASSPPDQVYYSGSAVQVPVALEIWNYGAESGSGTIFFDGYDSSMFNLQSQKTFSTIEGKEASRNPQGTYAFLDVGNVNVNLPTDVDLIEVPIRATACYDYKTAASFSICVDPNPSNTGKKACTPVNSISGSGGQGGPVEVASIQQESGVGKVILTITIKNVGGGSVIRSGKSSSCLNLGQADLNVVSVSGTISSGKKLTCSLGNSNTVRLVNNEGVVVCTADIDKNQNAYVTPVNLVIGYGYEYATQKNIEIKRI